MQVAHEGGVDVSEARSPLALSVQRCLIALLVVSIAFTAVAGAVQILADASEDALAVWIGAPAIAALGFALLLTFTVVLRRSTSTAVFAASVPGIMLASGGTICIIVLLTGSDHFDGDAEEALVRGGTISLAMAVALAYIAALAMVRTRSKLVRGMAIVTGLCAWGAAAILTTLLLAEWIGESDFGLVIMLVVMFGILLILTLVGTIAVPIAVSAAAKRHEAPESIDPRVRIDLGCPKCGERQTHRPGFARCSGCGAGLFIEVEEPRCECGYLLYQLTGNTCPECGRAVAAVSGGPSA